MHHFSCEKAESALFEMDPQKLGIELPKTIKEALDPDKKNGNTSWADAIAKEMKDICVAFKILLDGQSAPIGYQKMPCHMIFDIKMKTFHTKSD